MGRRALDRRAFLTGAAALGFSGAAGRPASAQSFPANVIRIVVPTSASTPPDILARIIATALSDSEGWKVVVENKAGAVMTIGAMDVLSQPADGHTLFSVTAPIAALPALVPNAQFNFEKDFMPVIRTGTGYNVLVVNPSVPAKSLSELLALARQKPGAVTFGSAGVGTALHIGALELESLAGVKITAVHYRGAAPALTDVMAGHIDAVIMGPSVALSAVREGKLRMLAFGSPRRVPQFPDVPTFAETVPGYEAGVSFGMFAAMGTPPDIVRKINADVQKIVADPEFKKKYLDPLAVQPISGPPEAFAEYLRKESTRWGEVIHAANVKVE
mgnify:CR=1 FL=1